ncbi:MAG: RNA 2',3'-cyclic phosphodiesterase [Usitatibacter sp.]
MRLFFALWPGERVRGELSRVADSLASGAGGRAVPAAKIHLTLAFLGEVPPERVGAALAAAAATRARRFEIVLDEVGSFRKARVGWAGCRRAPILLLELQSSLREALRECGFALEDRPFAAHVTLVRKIASPVASAAMPSIRWRPRDFVLVRSDGATGRYEVLETWPLDRG